MSARIYEALLACDEARYTPGGDLAGALCELRNIVAEAPDEARSLLPIQYGCYRTVQRHSWYLAEALK